MVSLPAYIDANRPNRMEPDVGGCAGYRTITVDPYQWRSFITVDSDRCMANISIDKRLFNFSCSYSTIKLVLNLNIIF